MSKVFFLIVIGNVSFLPFATGASIKLTAEVSILTKLGVHEKHRLEVTEKEIFYDSIQIDSVQILSLSKAIRRLSHIKKDNPDKCYAGTYTHKIKNAAKIQTTSGCLSSAPFLEISQALSRLKKSPSI